MDIKICNLLIDNRERIVPFLFTYKQVDIISRYLSNKSLCNTEKTYLYSSIKRKIDALSSLSREFYFYGTGMIPERARRARDILAKYPNAFISGSFLFSEKYNDIDLYIVSNRRKQYHKGKMHFIHITQGDLNKPIFQSPAKYCISNFFIELGRPSIIKPNFDELLMTYELAVNDILDNGDQKEIRDILFEYYLQIKGEVMGSFLLNKRFNEIKKLGVKERINYVNRLTKELLLGIYSNKYVYNELSPFVTRLREDAKNYPANENLLIYIGLFNEVKNECRRAEA
ncbi:MAG: hypothetical protein KJ561_05055 [Nanoarchaeota archaeon]|nr:hypothetical protein [Nanoarchaeota archaeon]